MGPRRLRATLLASGLLCATVGMPASAQAESAGWQVGSAVSTLVYAPVKVMYAATGLVFGGISWAMSGGNDEVARAVIEPAVQGDYLVTPEHLRRERGLQFVGRRSWEAPEEVAEDPAYADSPYEDLDYPY